MAVKLVDLADSLGLKVAELRDYIDFLDLDIPKNALEMSEEKAKILEAEVKKDMDVAPEETEDDQDEELEEDIEPKDIAISDESLSKVQEYEEALEQEIQREIKDEQRKMTAGKKEGKEKTKKKKVKEVKTAPNATEAAKDDAGVQEAVLRKATGIVEIPDVISVNDFAQRSGIPVARVIGELMKNGILATINQQIDYDTASIIAQDFDVKITRKREQASVEELMEADLQSFIKEDDKENLKERPPVVVVMGHVDHGKTKILDTIRSTDVVAGESGGITQHIGAYQIVHKDKRITFLDTPGHESFSAMRARGARVTDIAVLVVAADEGVKVQTEEAYQHAKAAGVPIIVAINKMDKENADPDRVKNELGQKLGIALEEWGGDVPVVPVSAMTGAGIQDLLDHILLIAEVNNYQANPNREAVGTVIESNLDKNLGPIATVIVNAGTLQIMDNVVIGESFGRIKKMMDHKGKSLRAVGPSGPVRIAGLSQVPLAGELMIVVKDEKTARDRALKIQAKRKITASKSSLLELMNRIKQGRLKTLKIIVKADTKGSLEAIKGSLAKIDSKEVGIQVIHSGIGNVTMNDVNMAVSSMAVIFAFHVDTPSEVERHAEQFGVEIRPMKIIYKLLEEVSQILEGLLDPEIVEVEVGEARVIQVFMAKKKDMIIGCKVTKGVMQNRIKVRVLRGDQLIGEGVISGLQRGPERVNEVKEGFECGIKFESELKAEPEDILQAYKTEKKKRTL
jgi:translation initiation factor IF-2